MFYGYLALLIFFLAQTGFAQPLPSYQELQKLFNGSNQALTLDELSNFTFAQAIKVSNRNEPTETRLIFHKTTREEGKVQARLIDNSDSVLPAELVAAHISDCETKLPPASLNLEMNGLTFWSSYSAFRSLIIGDNLLSRIPLQSYTFRTVKQSDGKRVWVARIDVNDPSYTWFWLSFPSAGNYSGAYYLTAEKVHEIVPAPITKADCRVASFPRVLQEINRPTPVASPPVRKGAGNYHPTRLPPNERPINSF